MDKKTFQNSTASLASRFSQIIQDCEEDARRKAADPYWSSRGHSVANDMLAAIGLIRKFPIPEPSNQNPGEYALKLLSALTESRMSYDRMFEDPDGFGGGVFNEVAKKLTQIIEELNVALQRNPYNEWRQSRFPSADNASSAIAGGDTFSSAPDYFKFDYQIAESLDLARGLIALGDHRFAFNLLQIHLLQLAYKIFLNLEELKDEEFLIFRSRLSHARRWMVTALTRGQFSRNELFGAFRWVGGAGSLLTFLQRAKNLKRRSVPTPFSISHAFEAIPFIAFQTEEGSLQIEKQLALKRFFSYLDQTLDDEARRFLFAMFPDMSETLAYGARDISVLAYISLDEHTIDSPFPEFPASEIEPARGVWCYRLDWSGRLDEIDCSLTQLDETTELIDSVSEFYRGASHSARFGIDDSGGDLERQREQLSKCLIEALANKFPFRSTVVVIAEGAMALVPFSILIAPSGRNLSQAHTLVTAGSCRSLPKLRLLDEVPDHATGLVIGDPLFENDHRLTSGFYLRRLPESRRECQSVAKIFGTLAILGKNARKAAFLSAIERANFLHLATHGVIVRAVQLLSLKLRFESPSALLGQQKDALESARIAFSDGSGSEEQTYLTAEQISQLKLEHLELAFLSMCLGSAGSAVAGETTFGTARAFLAAGCRRVIASILPVPDSQASDLAIDFYSRLRDGCPPEKALTLAQNRMSDNGVPWFAWGGYQFHL